MKSILFKIALILWCIPTFSMPGTDPKLKGKYTQEKTIKKEFKVNTDALLRLENRYGNLFITAWDQNTTIVEVHVKTNSNNEKKAQERLDEIKIDFEASNDLVQARTIFNDNRWGWSSNNVSMEINYTVKVPRNNRLDLNNDYGTIYLDEINGTTRIHCDYGSMKIGKLNAATNDLYFDYSSGVSFEYINGANIEADYSKFSIENAETLDIEADYSKSSIKNVGSINFSCEYGDISIENANKVIGDGDYLTTRLGRIHGDVQIDTDYGSIKIKEMAADAGNLYIDCNYTHVEVGYHSDYHFDFTTELEYAGFNGDTDFEYSIKREKSSDSFYQGYYGSKGKNIVKFSIEYGGLKMIKR